MAPKFLQRFLNRFKPKPPVQIKTTAPLPEPKVAAPARKSALTKLITRAFPRFRKPAEVTPVTTAVPKTAAPVGKPSVTKLTGVPDKKVRVLAPRKPGRIKKKRGKYKKRMITKVPPAPVQPSAEVEYLNEEFFDEQQRLIDEANYKRVAEQVKGKTQDDLLRSKSLFSAGLRVYEQITRMINTAQSYGEGRSPHGKHAKWLLDLLNDEFSKSGKITVLYALGTSETEMIYEAQQCIDESDDSRAVELLFALRALITQALPTAQEAKEMNEHAWEEWDKAHSDGFFTEEDYASLPFSEEEWLEAFESTW